MYVRTLNGGLSLCKKEITKIRTKKLVLARAFASNHSKKSIID